MNLIQRKSETRMDVPKKLQPDDEVQASVPVRHLLEIAGCRQRGVWWTGPNSEDDVTRGDPYAPVGAFSPGFIKELASELLALAPPARPLAHADVLVSIEMAVAVDSNSHRMEWISDWPRMRYRSGQGTDANLNDTSLVRVAGFSFNANLLLNPDF